MSTPENPAYDIAPASTGSQPDGPYPPITPRPAEDPSWGGLAVLSIALVTIAAVVFFVVVLIFAAHKYLYPDLQVLEVVQRHPLLIVLAQVLAYFVVIAFMVLLVKRGWGQSFWQAVRWNWPANPWAFVAGGVGLAIGLQLLGRLLPMPKELPIDRFFQTPAEAWVLAVFGLTLAPLMEELFFRGFLYPVLARWLGVSVSVVCTGLGFGLIHASQLGRAWAPVLVIFLVGVALTVVRAVTKSVAAGFLMHFAYNGTIFSLMFIVTGGFRHLEKLTQ